MKTSQVFGISPEISSYSYVDRGNLDASVTRMLERNTHIAVRGPSKCGKSWLRQKVLTKPIIVQCRLGKPFTDIYVDALSQLDINIQVKESSQGVFKAKLSANSEAGSALLIKAGINASIEKESSRSLERQVVGHDLSDLRFVANIIKESRRRLVIEDFHYMSTEDRKNFAFDLKALWDYGVFVLIIGIWSETNLLLHLNPDLTGRVAEASIDWSSDDLMRILNNGGNALNLEFAANIQSQLVSLSYSNAGLLQQLTLLTLDDMRIYERNFLKKIIDNPSFVENASMLYADQLNPVYQQFAKRVAAGMRTRKSSTGIYAHTMAVIMEATDTELIKGLHARNIFERAVMRESRIQYSNLKTILDKFQELQIDEAGRGLIIGYSPATEEVNIVDRQLLLYRRFATVKWPWEGLIKEAYSSGGQVEPG